MNVLIANPNRIDEGILSGGSWVSTLPLTNLQKREIPEVARTTDTLNSSTTFNLSLARSRRTKVFAFVNHNLSNQATYRIRSSNEQPATNLLTYSEEFDRASWIKANCSIAANSSVAPNGSITMDKIVESIGSAAQHAVLSTISGINVGGNNTASVYIKSDGIRNNARISLVSPGFVNGCTGIVNLITGQISEVISLGSGTLPNITVVNVGGGIYRVAISCVIDANSSQAVLAIYPHNGTTDFYPGDGSSGIYVWGAQFESGALATSYYSTTSAPATRPAGYIDTWQSYDYDSGVIPVWEAIYPTSVLYWEDANFWTGQQLDEDKIGYNLTLIKVLGEASFAQHYRVDFFDQTNPNGYVQIGRMFLSDGWQPAINMSYGATISNEDETQVGEAKNKSEYFDRKNLYRVAQFTLDWMDEDEGFSKAFDFQRRAGIHGEVLYMWNPEDTIHRSRRSFMGRLRKLTPLEMPNFNNTKISFEIKELL